MTESKEDGDLTLEDVQGRIEGLTEDVQKAVVCALVGHSRLQKEFWGCFNCVRCGAQVGDTLGGVYPGASRAVIIGCDCKTCRASYGELTWRDTFMCPDPFTEQEKETAKERMP